MTMPLDGEVKSDQNHDFFAIFRVESNEIVRPRTQL